MWHPEFLQKKNAETPYANTTFSMSKKRENLSKRAEQQSKRCLNMESIKSLFDSIFNRSSTIKYTAVMPRKYPNINILFAI
jgi:hypothetical protein